MLFDRVEPTQHYRMKQMRFRESLVDNELSEL